MDLDQLRESIALIQKGEQMKKEGQQIINETMKQLKESSLRIINYQNYSSPGLHISDERVLADLFQTYFIKPFGLKDSEYKTEYSADVDGMKIFAISKTPMPHGATVVCVSKPPAREAI